MFLRIPAQPHSSLSLRTDRNDNGNLVAVSTVRVLPPRGPNTSKGRIIYTRGQTDLGA